MEENSDIYYNTVITKEVMPNKIYQTQKHKHVLYEAAIATECRGKVA